MLRGPQGALYGRNATAGAINIITRTPGDTLRIGADLSYGNYDSFATKGSISLPVGGGFAAGVSGSYADRDGYFRNTVTDNRLENLESYTVRGKLAYSSPGGGFNALLSGDMSAFDSSDYYTNLFSGTTFVGLGKLYEVASDALSESLGEMRVQSRGVSLTLNADIADRLSLTSIASYRTFSNFTAYDADATAVPALVSRARNQVDSFNAELHLQYENERLKAMAGVNYYSDDQAFGFKASAPTVAPVELNSPYDIGTLKAAAAFTQIEWEFADRLTLVGGLRFNHEEREYTIDYRGVGGQLLQGNVSDDTLLPAVGLNFQATADILVYGEFGRGYQSPGFTATPGVTATRSAEFSAEYLDAFELGIKTQFLERRVTFNAALFHYNYRDIQVRTTNGFGIIVVSNVAAGKIDGAEANLSVRLGGGLTLSVAISYLDARYTNFCELTQPGSPPVADPPCIGPVTGGVYADRTGNKLNQAPECQGGVTLDHTTHIGGLGELNATVSYNGVSNVFFGPSNEPLQSSGGGYGRIDARIGLEVSPGLELYAYGKNLTHDHYIDLALRGSPTVVLQHVSDPATYGVGIRFRM